MSELTRQEIERVMREFLKARAGNRFDGGGYFWNVPNFQETVNGGDELTSPVAFCAILDELERRGYAWRVEKGIGCANPRYSLMLIGDDGRPVFSPHGSTKYIAAFRAALAVLDLENRCAPANQATTPFADELRAKRAIPCAPENQAQQDSKPQSDFGVGHDPRGGDAVRGVEGILQWARAQQDSKPVNVPYDPKTGWIGQEGLDKLALSGMAQEIEFLRRQSESLNQRVKNLGGQVKAMQQKSPASD